MNKKVKEIIADKGRSTDEDFEGGHEEEGGDLSDANIRSYPSDYTLRGIYEKWKRGDIRIPSYQRAYVWSQKQASMLIDSFLSGLTVPPVFLYENTEYVSLVIDGQQRIKTIVAFIDGAYPNDPRETMHSVDENDTGKKTTKFVLKLDEKNQYNNLSYDQLSDPKRRQFDNAVLRAVNIFQTETQKNTVGPNDQAKKNPVHEIFRRLNTGGSRLSSQEIRNCVWEGGFNETLNELNKYDSWREILGKPKPHKRLRDVELILRIFALQGEGRKKYKPSLLEFLNKAMEENQSGKTPEVEKFVLDFKKCADVICEKFDPKPCSFPTAINEQVLDAVFCVVLDNLNNLPSDVGKKYRKIKKKFKDEIISGAATAGKVAINNRYDWLKSELLKES